MEEKLYYLVKNNVGLSLYDVSNDSMTSIMATRDKSKWLKVTKEEAKNIEKYLDFESILVD